MSKIVTPALGQRPNSGVLLFGYEVIDVIGRGAGSTLFAASDPASGQVYALKHVRVDADRDLRFVEQLRAEFDVSRAVRHPGLRAAIDFKERKNSVLSRRIAEAILLLELFDGQSLEQSSLSDLPAILGCFVRVAQTLAVLHRAGFVHCDIKPNNILVGSAGEVRVIDLGQACRAGTVKPRIQGTPDYIAPEQVNCDPVTPRTDIFNLGATLYVALTGRKIPTLYTTKQTANSFLVDDRIPAPSDLNPSVPPPLSSLVMECVRTNPAKRPADMRDVILRLQIAEHRVTRQASVG